MALNKKYYAIKHGKVDNIIVGTWKECEDIVKDVPRAVYKSFPDRKSAEAWLNGIEAAEIPVINDEETFFVFSDGACSGNPGPGGWGAVIKYNGQFKELSGGERETTNNIMELEGMINALRFAIEHATRTTKIIAVSDSSYVINGLTKWLKSWKNNNWKRSNGEDVLNLPQWKELDRILSLEYNIEFRWTKGHAGQLENERCDALAVAQKNKFLDVNKTELLKENRGKTNLDLFKSLDVESMHKLLTSVKFKNFLLQKDSLSIYQMLNAEAVDWGIEGFREKIDTL